MLNLKYHINIECKIKFKKITCYIMLVTCSFTVFTGREFLSPGVWRSVTGCSFPDVLRQHFETSGAGHPVARLHIPKEQYLHVSNTCNLIYAFNEFIKLLKTFHFSMSLEKLSIHKQSVVLTVRVCFVIPRVQLTNYCSPSSQSLIILEYTNMP